MAVSSIHTGFGFRQNGGRANNDDISVYYAGTEAIRIDGTDINFVDTIAPLTSDAAALGTGSLMWSDLFLASASVINFDNGDVTLTHSANILTVGGGDLLVANTFGIVIGHTAQITTSGLPEFQILGTAAADSSMSLGRWSADGNGVDLHMAKSRGAAIATDTVVQDNDIIGGISWFPADGTDVQTRAAQWYVEVDDGSPAADDVGMAYVWRQMAGGGAAIAETMRLSAAGDLSIANGGGIIVGNASQVTVSDGDGATSMVPEAQVLGTVAADGSLLLATYNTTNTQAVAPHLALLKGGAAAIGTNTTALADNEVVGSIIWYGTDGTDALTPVAAIQAVVDDSGGPGAGAIGGSLEIYTTADGGETLTLFGTINNDQNLYVANGNGIVVGHTAQITTDLTSELQVLGTTEADASLTLGEWVASGSGPVLGFVKSRNGTINSHTIVADNDAIGEVRFFPDDGTDFATMAAYIRAEVDDASPAAGDVGMSFVFAQMPGGGGAIAQTWRMAAAGQFISGGITANPANVTADGSILAEGGLAFTDVANAHIDDATHGNGTVVHYIGNVTITTSSDMRVKTGVRDWDGSALDLLDKARLVEFNYNLPGGGSQTEGYGPNARGRYVGMLAQETIEWAPWIINAGAGKECPRCVVGRECEEHSSWTVEYQHLVPLLVKGIQELRKENQELRQKIAQN